MSFVPKSKFRHVFGKALRRDQCYDGIRITKSSWDSTFTAVNPKFVAIITESAGGGAFLVLPLAKVGRVAHDCALVTGHRAAVLDIAFCPHNDNIIASASEDCSIKIWMIPDGGLVTCMTESVVDLLAHQRRVGIVVWHPSAHNILLSAGSDNKIFIWNCGTGEPLVEIELPDLILSVSFNYNGSRVAVTTKDKMIRILDPRTGSEIKSAKGHQGSKPSQCVFLRNGKIFTTGFSRMSERQYALWDEKDLSSPLTMQEVDSSNGVLFPFYDPDTNIVYLCGKGDCSISYYEIIEGSPFVYYLSTYKTSEPQRGIGMMPKRGVNVNQCEISRFYKLLNNGLCEVIPFTVPRKSELYQDDLYPDTADESPAISAHDWFNGKDADPVLVSLKDGFKSTAKEPLKTVRRSNILDKMKPAGGNDSPPAQTPSRGSPTPAAAPVVHAPKPEPVVHSPAPAPAPVSKPAPPQNEVKPAPAPAAAAAEPVVNQRQSANLSNTPSSNNVPAGTPSLPPNFDPKVVMEEVKMLTATVEKLDKRIEELESRLAALECDEEGEEDDNNDNDEGDNKDKNDDDDSKVDDMPS
ncbi:coronin-1C-A isoform X1 [Octopus vulgaris]|uniref:Coronin n=1 Tax=Octopus vulgaris TaxID=6645 RepID=A0AA36FL77_OCTVU|nr:coronin-1C-A isoform X1 [Octopus vulgaris]